MEVILSGIAILFSLVSWNLRRKISNLENIISNINIQMNSHAERLGASSALPAQAASVSNEISTLKIEVGCIRRELQANSQKLLIHTQILESIKLQQSVAEVVKATPQLEIDRQEFGPFSELDRSSQGTTLFPFVSSVASLGAEQPAQVHPVDDFLPIEEPPAQPPKPYEQVAQQYQDALDRGDRQALRQLQFKELNITSECEDSLLRGSSGQATKLEAVHGGGSYMVVSGEGLYWLFPTAQTLDSFSMNQPQKGIFDYEREILSRPVVKKPAEVRDESDYWIVIAQGVISIPG